MTDKNVTILTGNVSTIRKEILLTVKMELSAQLFLGSQSYYYKYIHRLTIYHRIGKQIY